MSSHQSGYSCKEKCRPRKSDWCLFYSASVRICEDNFRRCHGVPLHFEVERWFQIFKLRWSRIIQLNFFIVSVPLSVYVCLRLPALDYLRLVGYADLTDPLCYSTLLRHFLNARQSSGRRFLQFPHREILSQNSGGWGDLESPHKISLIQPSFTIPCGNRTQRGYVLCYLF